VQNLITTKGLKKLAAELNIATGTITNIRKTVGIIHKNQILDYKGTLASLVFLGFFNVSNPFRPPTLREGKDEITTVLLSGGFILQMENKD
jgi:hypothetical protein